MEVPGRIGADFQAACERQSNFLTPGRHAPPALQPPQGGFPSPRRSFRLGSARSVTRLTGAPQSALPIGAGLNALTKIWESLGYPSGVAISEGAEIEAMLTDVTARHTPD